MSCITFFFRRQEGGWQRQDHHLHISEGSESKVNSVSESSHRQCRPRQTRP
jgi:hypothetical protein